MSPFIYFWGILNPRGFSSNLNVSVLHVLTQPRPKLSNSLQ